MMAVTDRTGMPLHFAYGSNMSRAAMRGRCPDARPIGLARLAGWRFIINLDGYASVLQQPGSIVHGVLWQVSMRDLAALNAYEGIDRGLYRACDLPVMASGLRKRALVYLAGRRGAGRPRPGYLEGVVTAAREWQLPEAYVAALQGWSQGGWQGARAAEPREVAIAATPRQVG